MMALERIKKLFGLAKEERPKRYIKMAEKISSRTRTKIPKELKDQVCRGCGTLLVPGKNATVRIARKERRLICHECGKLHVFPLKPRQ